MRPIALSAVVVVMVGCSPNRVATRLDSPAQPVARSCTSVSGRSLGALPLEVNVGGQVVRFTEWTTADELATDVVGFAARLPEGVSFSVRAGERTFFGTQSRWVHPAGVAGPRVHGIDEVTFCSTGAPPAVAMR